VIKLSYILRVSATYMLMKSYILFHRNILKVMQNISTINLKIIITYTSSVHYLQISIKTSFSLYKKGLGGGGGCVSGSTVMQLLEAVCYKPKGRRLYSHFDF
jgi:hypothetical protein